VLVSVAIVFLETDNVFTVNVAAVWPTGTDTLDGTTATVESLFSLIARPPFGAGLLIVTVPCTRLPTAAVLEDKSKADSTGARIVSEAVEEEP